MPESASALPTFSDHIQELRSRLFYVALAFVVSSAVAYPFFEQIVNLVTTPLGGAKLYYLTPGGGLTFIIKVCMYIGFIGMLPVAVYQLYRFISPIIDSRHSRNVAGYTIASAFLALLGIAFSYYVSLPAALHFLTTIELLDIKPMLTIDSYMSFVGAYLLAGALLFQMPLILLLINSITPTPPSKLMSLQKYIIVGAFIFAAVISPTPDAVNQTILALPIIVTYQIGILAVWLRQRQQRPSAKVVRRLPSMSTDDPSLPHAVLDDLREVSRPVVKPVHAQATPAPKPKSQMRQTRTRQSRSMDIVVPKRERADAIRLQTERANSVQKPRRSIDGVFAPTGA